jgi:CTP:molybdopterin cytidylyltransferase MocA
MNTDSTVQFGIILAAGGSTRMGEPKALLMHNGEYLINAHAQALQDHCDHIIAVVGRHAEQIVPRLSPEVKVVHNPNWADSHMSDSLRLALEQCHGTAIVTPVDCPPAPHHVLLALQTAGAPAVVQHNGEDGHPVLIDVASALAQKSSLQQLLLHAPRVNTTWSGALENWNTPTEWAAYSELDSGFRS